MITTIVIVVVTTTITIVATTITFTTTKNNTNNDDNNNNDNDNDNDNNNKRYPIIIKEYEFRKREGNFYAFKNATIDFYKRLFFFQTTDILKRKSNLYILKHIILKIEKNFES